MGRIKELDAISGNGDSGRRRVMPFVHESTNGKSRVFGCFTDRRPEVRLDLKDHATESWLVTGSGMGLTRGSRRDICRARFCARMANAEERVPQLLSGR